MKFEFRFVLVDIFVDVFQAKSLKGKALSSRDLTVPAKKVTESTCNHRRTVVFNLAIDVEGL